MGFERAVDIALPSFYAGGMKCWDLSRRELLCAAAGAASLRQLAFSAQTSSRSDASPLAMPGPYRGRVVAIEHPGSIVSGTFYREPIRQMIQRGIMELTGAPDPVAAWKVFFQPGDVVGIKLSGVGYPHVYSSAEVVQTVIEGVRSAGLKSNDILLYERYRQEVLRAGYDKWLPDGVRWRHAAERYEPVQQAIEGYDPDHYMEMNVVLPGQDMNNPNYRRSFVARAITQEISKLINIPTLKDHQSAGVTLALKNLSHGGVNNVNRSHSTPTLNVCGAFIPAVVSTAAIRNKAVLHILDGTKGLYHGGPGGRPQFVWEHRQIYFATDPVALDRIGWLEIDKKRIAEGMKPMYEAQPDQFSRYPHRQVEHIEIAGALGLGEFDEKKIDLRRLTLG